MEEYFKILRSGFAEKSFAMLKDTKLLRAITPELEQAGPAFWESIRRLDDYRNRFAAAPDTLTNAILAGTILVPLGLAGGPRRYSADALERKVELGVLPMPRRDVERLHQILALQPRLLDLRAPLRAQRAVMHRHAFHDALIWLEIHGGRPDVLQHWQSLETEPGPGHVPGVDGNRQPAGERPLRRRRRRRRRGRGSPSTGQT